MDVESNKPFRCRRPEAGHCPTKSQDGLSRRDLDVALLVAEAEPILGLPEWPAPLATDDERAVDGFELRRVEGACAAHAVLVAEATERLALLQVRHTRGWMGHAEHIVQRGSSASA